MKYNAKYKRWFTKGGLVYRYSKPQDKLLLCLQSTTNRGYKQCSSHGKTFLVHRAIYETFVGEIPDGHDIDHINTIKVDNRIENLRAVTPKENMNNPLTRKHISEGCMGRTITEETRKKISHSLQKPHSNSDFGMKYFEHFGYGRTENLKQYYRECVWYWRHGKCRWE